MLPVFTRFNVRNHGFTDGVVLGYRPTGPWISTDRAHFSISYFCASVFDAIRQSVFGGSILRVVFRCTGKQMLQLIADWVVAVVTYKNARRQLAVRLLVSPAMEIHTPAIAAGPAISLVRTAVPNFARSGKNFGGHRASSNGSRVKRIGSVPALPICASYQGVS